VGEVAILSNPNLSVDGKRTSFDLANPRTKNVDVWTIDLERGTSARFTFDPAEETIGVWSRDGKWIAFRSSADNMQGIHLKNSNGLEQDKLLALRPNGSYDLLPNSWSVDDSQLLATAQNTGGGSQLVLVNVKDGSVTPFLPSKNNQRSGQISPDNKWVAYETDETGDWEVYVTTYPVPGGKLQVSRNGGKQPRWRADGKEIFYIDASGKLVAVPITVEGSLSTGKPELLYAIDTRPPLSSTDLFMYDVSPDGKRFLVNRYQNPAHVPPLNIILNSTSEK
jgi:Tol biopolymer transport system component